jgi:G:T-mismatch repair DNA endonuclease (very short patch repair protein)
MPATNQEYWESKIARNVEPDHQTRIQLDALEWDVQIIWECELQQGVDTIMKQLNERRWQEASRVA